MVELVKVYILISRYMENFKAFLSVYMLVFQMVSSENASKNQGFHHVHMNMNTGPHYYENNL